MVQKAERELQAQKAEETKAEATGESGKPPGEATGHDASRNTFPQGYDRHGSPVVSVSAPARINVYA